MICPKCKAVEVYCPVCFCMYPHGSVEKCKTKTCLLEDPALKCTGCGSIATLSGVLISEMEMLPYVRTNEFVCPVCVESGLVGRDTVHPDSDKRDHPTRGIICCSKCEQAGKDDQI